MNLKGEITEGAMRQGVKDSDALIVFLTNSYLSRPFCLKELGWAIEFDKPILVVVEKEGRFWSWDRTFCDLSLEIHVAPVCVNKSEFRLRCIR